MHWLNDRIGEVDELAHRMLLTKATDSMGSAAVARRAFLQEVTKLAAQIAAREGVTACVVAHDGLVLARSGRRIDEEAVAATGGLALLQAQRAGRDLSLGAVRQIVLIGDENKLALFSVGTLTVAVLAPGEVNLASALM